MTVSLTQEAFGECPSMARCILTEGDETGYHTLVVGIEGISGSDGSLFGSACSKSIDHVKNCTVQTVGKGESRNTPLRFRDPSSVEFHIITTSQMVTATHCESYECPSRPSGPRLTICTGIMYKYHEMSQGSRPATNLP
jgi:hypothetical protein